jgi:hypothetical protein
MSDEIASAALKRLLGINKSVLSELAQRGIVDKQTRVSSRSRWRSDPSLAGAWQAQLRGS